MKLPVFLYFLAPDVRSSPVVSVAEVLYFTSDTEGSCLSYMVVPCISSVSFPALSFAFIFTVFVPSSLNTPLSSAAVRSDSV